MKCCHFCLGQFFIAQITMVTLAIFCNAFVLSLFHRSRHHAHVPSCVRKLISFLPGDNEYENLPCSVSGHRGKSHSLQLICNSINNGLPTALSPNGISGHGHGGHGPAAIKATNLEGPDPKETSCSEQHNMCEYRKRNNNACNDSFLRNYGKIADCLGQIDSFLLKYESAQINEREWKRLAYIFDKLFAVFFVIVALAMGAVFKLSYVETARNLFTNDQSPDLCSTH